MFVKSPTSAIGYVIDKCQFFITDMILILRFFSLASGVAFSLFGSARVVTKLKRRNEGLIKFVLFFIIFVLQVV